MVKRQITCVVEIIVFIPADTKTEDIEEAVNDELDQAITTAYQLDDYTPWL